jgi:hypothetical protein
MIRRINRFLKQIYKYNDGTFRAFAIFPRVFSPSVTSETYVVVDADYNGKEPVPKDAKQVSPQLANALMRLFGDGKGAVMPLFEDTRGGEIKMPANFDLQSHVYYVSPMPPPRSKYKVTVRAAASGDSTSKPAL